MSLQGQGVYSGLTSPFPLQTENSWGTTGRRCGKGRGTQQYLECNAGNREGISAVCRAETPLKNHWEGYCWPWGKERFYCYFCYRKLKRLRLYIQRAMYKHTHTFHSRINKHGIFCYCNTYIYTFLQEDKPSYLIYQNFTLKNLMLLILNGKTEIHG